VASTKRTWLWVILGVFGTLFLIVIVFIGSAFYMFRTHVRNESVETPVAEQRFNQQRERFKGQQPLVEFVGGNRDNDDEAIVHRPSPTAPRARINTMRVLIYDQSGGHLIHADVPGWLLRMMPNGRYGGWDDKGPPMIPRTYNDEFARHRITMEDIERHGLGLVLDGHNQNTRILIWSE
jgi:hypothetical protein